MESAGAWRDLKAASACNQFAVHLLICAKSSSLGAASFKLPISRQHGIAAALMGIWLVPHIDQMISEEEWSAIAKRLGITPRQVQIIQAFMNGHGKPEIGSHMVQARTG